MELPMKARIVLAAKTAFTFVEVPCLYKMEALKTVDGHGSCPLVCENRANASVAFVVPRSPIEGGEEVVAAACITYALCGGQSLGVLL